MATASSNRVFSGDNAAGWQRWHPGALAMEATPRAAAQAAESPEAIKRRAHAAGFEEGKNAGLAAGLAEGRKLAAAEAQQIRAVAQAATAALQTLGDTLAGKTVRLAIAIAQKLLLREIETHPDALTAIVRDALNLLPDAAERVRILVNSADADLVRRFVCDGTSLPPTAVIVASDVARGGCYIQSSCGDVDATLETRTQRVLDALGANDHATSGN